jgi:hypothetical protein
LHLNDQAKAKNYALCGLKLDSENEHCKKILEKK